MKYIIIRIYSFECEHPAGCDEIIECGGPYIEDALRELKIPSTGWSVVKGNAYCHKHKPAGKGRGEGGRR